MPIIISILNPKGGSGKTTLATNLSRALSIEARADVLLVDTDPQGTARDWNAAAADEGDLFDGASGGVTVAGLTNARTLRRDLARLGAPFEFVVVDGAAKAETMSAAAVRASDLVLVPVQPSPLDIWGCSDLVDIIEAAQIATGGQPVAAFVVSRQIGGTRLSAEIDDALAAYGLPVLKARTTQRVAYPEASMQGISVLDVRSDRTGSTRDQRHSRRSARPSRISTRLRSGVRRPRTRTAYEDRLQRTIYPKPTRTPIVTATRREAPLRAA